MQQDVFQQMRAILKAPNFGNINQKKKNAFFKAITANDYTLFAVLLEGTQNPRFENDWLLRNVVGNRRHRMVRALYETGIPFNLDRARRVIDYVLSDGPQMLIPGGVPLEIKF